MTQAGHGGATTRVQVRRVDAGDRRAGVGGVVRHQHHLRITELEVELLGQLTTQIKSGTSCMLRSVESCLRHLARFSEYLDRAHDPSPGNADI